MAANDEGEAVGRTEFLVGMNGATPSNLPEAIKNLEDASLVFMNRWTIEDFERAGKISEDAMTLLDFIANELLREEVARKGTGTYTGTPFATELACPFGQGVTDAALGDQLQMVQAGAGNGRLPAHLGPILFLSLRQLLNKIKHRNRLINFRFDAGKHIFVICTDHTYGGAEGIYEFEISGFCRQCQSAAAAL
jgi:hypothetical protein